MSNKFRIEDQVIGAIHKVTGERHAALHESSFNGNEWLYLKQCLDSTFVSSVGKFVDRFESDVQDFTGAKYCVATVNGTSALHIALKVAGVKAGDEVMMPALTFVAQANAVTYCNATPHFVESEESTLGVDAYKLRDYLINFTEQRSKLCINSSTGNIIRALVPMHTFGHPSDIDALLAISRDFNIILLEDSSESLGSFYNDIHTGTFGKLGTLSFNGNKTITTGGGGAIITNDFELAKYAKHLTTTAKLKHDWEYRHDDIGYNYRMPNINAALGCAQLEQLPSILTRKRDLFEKYKIAFKGVQGVNLITEPSNCRSNFWLQTLILDEDCSEERDLILQATNDKGLMTRPAWVLMSELAPYAECPHMNLKIAKSLTKRLLNIPSNLIND